MKTNVGTIDITIFTDPLCCWSWAFEPQLQQLKKALGAQVTWTYRMAGLIPSWHNFHDTVNSVSRPAQMGPVWMHAGQMAEQSICHQVWLNDPPASSYPACIAVKCAQLQSAAAGEAMLSLLRQACMGEGKNIAKQDILFAAANLLAIGDPAFNIAVFKEDFFNDRGLEAFRADLEQVSYYRINRFPSLLIRAQHSKPILISGYRDYNQVLQAIDNISQPEKQA